MAAGGVGGTGSTTRTNANANNGGQGQEEKKKKGWLDRPAPLVGESWRAVLAVAGWGGWLALLGVWIGWGVGGGVFNFLFFFFFLFGFRGEFFGLSWASG